MTIIQNETLILFQGDSITDGGRNREVFDDLGWSYASLTAAWFSALYPEKKVRFLNRGVGGDLIHQMEARWQQDCLALKPDWVSILIGINNVWHGFDAEASTSLEYYQRSYRAMLEQVRRSLDARLILLEPFVLPVKEEQRAWRQDLDPAIIILRDLAREFEALLVPLDGLFAAAAVHRPYDFWLSDGVHPTQAGHALIAQAWLRTVGAFK